MLPHRLGKANLFRRSRELSRETQVLILPDRVQDLIRRRSGTGIHVPPRGIGLHAINDLGGLSWPRVSFIRRQIIGRSGFVDDFSILNNRFSTGEVDIFPWDADVRDRGKDSTTRFCVLFRVLFFFRIPRNFIGGCAR